MVCELYFMGVFLARYNENLHQTKTIKDIHDNEFRNLPFRTLPSSDNSDGLLKSASEQLSPID